MAKVDESNAQSNFLFILLLPRGLGVEIFRHQIGHKVQQSYCCWASVELWTSTETVMNFSY